MDTWKRIGDWASHGVVMGSHIRCTKGTKIDQNALVVSIEWQRKVFRICPEWLIWSIFGLNGHLKEHWSQSKSWRGHGIAHEVHQKAPKLTKMHQSGIQSTTAKYFNFVLSDYCDPFLDLMDTWKWIKVRASHGGAMEGLWGRTWGAPKCTKMHWNGHHAP